MYNIWLLVDFSMQEWIDMIETWKEPRISLSRFLRWLDKALLRPLSARSELALLERQQSTDTRFLG